MQAKQAPKNTDRSIITLRNKERRAKQRDKFANRRKAWNEKKLADHLASLPAKLEAKRQRVLKQAKDRADAEIAQKLKAKPVPLTLETVMPIVALP